MAARPLDTDDESSLAEWVDRFSGHVAGLEYEQAAAMMDPGVISFSTWSDIVDGVEHWVDDQWRKVWPSTADFRFETEKMRSLVSDDRRMASVAVTWASTGFNEDQTTFDRPGRCTMVLVRDDVDQPWRAAQGHFSLHRGVPQQSYRNRTPGG